MALLAISLFSLSNNVQKSESKTSFACRNDIFIVNNADEPISKIIAESDVDYQDLDNIPRNDTDQNDDFSWDTDFTLRVKFDYQPTVGYSISLYGSVSGLITCQNISNGVQEYVFPNLSDCEDYTIVYNTTTC